MKITALILIAYLISACSSDKQMKQQIEKVLTENPELIFKTIEENPTKFMMSVEKASRSAREDLAKQQRLEEERQMQAAFETPLKPEINDQTIIRGNPKGPIILVEYSDFECPFCDRGFNTVQQLMKKYPGKIQFIYKHLPLSFHKQAMISAKYFEAIALQSKEKAFKFHDQVFENQSKLKMGEKFLKKIAKDLKVDLMRLQKDLDSPKVNTKIASHIEEAKKFGISGTPGFVINGIPVKGALPAQYFEQIIAKLQQKGKLTL